MSSLPKRLYSESESDSESPPDKVTKLDFSQILSAGASKSLLDDTSPPGFSGADSGISVTSPNAELESDSHAIVCSHGNNGKVEDLGTVRSSARVYHQRLRIDEQRKESDLPAVEVVNLEPKSKRAWEQWSWEDKAIFFEALNECGKNFDAMQIFFHKKNRKNKNKEQIRTFYYRTWHKICKYVDFQSEYDLKKSSKELYGLINFGELRKRLGSQLDDKTGMKLRELIFKGHTNVRIKGKTYRLRTPTCAALKKLNESTVINLHHNGTNTVPAKLVLNLTPRTSSDFDLVHRVCQANPHVSLSLRPGRSLASVMEHLKTRWKTELPMWMLAKNQLAELEPQLTVTGPTTSASLSLSNLKNNSQPALDPIESAEKSKREWDLDSAKSMSMGQLYLILNETKNNGTTAELNMSYTFKSGNKNLSSCMSMLARLAYLELSKKRLPTHLANGTSHLPISPVAKNHRSDNSPTLVSSSSGSMSAVAAAQSSQVALSTGGCMEENHEFRRPSLPLSKQHQAFKQQVENMMPKYSRRTGRPISRLKRNVANVPTRTLQPAPTLKSVDGQVKLRLMPNITLTHPVVSIQTAALNPTNPQVHQASLTGSASVAAASSNVINPPELDHGNSNDSIASTLSYFDGQQHTRSDHFLDSVLENSNSSVLQTPPRVRPTPPTSPSRAVSSDTWIPDLSSFLSNLNSKETVKVASMNEDSVQSTGSEVDRQLLSMMSESSVDFTSKFAKLASAVVNSGLEESQ